MNCRPLTSSALCPSVIAIMLFLAASAPAENWPRFRGPGGSGISSQQGLPVRWTESDYAWKVKVPGLGHSSPCIWDDYLFITTAMKDGQSRSLLAYDTTTGDLRWSKETRSKSHRIHLQNSFASATPTTDGTRVYALFTSDKHMLLRAYDFDGEALWQKDLGGFLQKDNQMHGSGTSPIVFEDLVIVANQQDGPSAVIAFDSQTGDVRWKSERKAIRTTAHSTPIVLRRKDAPPQLFFTNTGDGIASLNPETGLLLFRADIMNARCVGSPIVAGNVVLATCGGGGRGRYLAAMPVGDRGELKADKAAWSLERNLPYVPTPVSYNGLVFLWGDNGAVVCVDAKTGAQKWIERVGGSYSGSPVYVDGKLYCISMDGIVSVVKASDTYELLGQTPLGEQSRTTPAVAGGRMFLRGFEHLFCLKAKAE